MTINLKFLDFTKSKDPDIKKIVADKTTFEIVMLFYKYELDKKEII